MNVDPQTGGAVEIRHLEVDLVGSQPQAASKVEECRVELVKLDGHPCIADSLAIDLDFPEFVISNDQKLSRMEKR